LGFGEFAVGHRAAEVSDKVMEPVLAGRWGLEEIDVYQAFQQVVRGCERGVQDPGGGTVREEVAVEESQERKGVGCGDICLVADRQCIEGEADASVDLAQCCEAIVGETAGEIAQAARAPLALAARDTNGER
jgi:hypothetical protein